MVYHFWLSSFVDHKLQSNEHILFFVNSFKMHFIMQLLLAVEMIMHEMLAAVMQNIKEIHNDLSLFIHKMQ